MRLRGWKVVLLVLAFWAPLPAAEERSPPPLAPVLSDHFDGTVYFNPGQPPEPQAAGGQSRGRSSWVWRWLLGLEWPEWPENRASLAGPPPVQRVPMGELRVTPVGHATFLVQMDGLNLLIDPIWSDRCSPVPWVGPKRHQAPGIRFADLPPIDAVLVTHNHYDHLDRATLEQLARRGAPRAVTPLGNGQLVRETGIPQVEELDWWGAVRLSREVTVTCVPAQHFSSRTLWDRNEALWGGFVISGPAGSVFHAGDTGYGPHFQEIARRFPGLRVALLPISPYRPVGSQAAFPPWSPSSMHMGPAEAVRVHQELGAALSVAIHYQVFQLGADGFDEAVRDLSAALAEQGLARTGFLTPPFGWAIVPRPGDSPARPQAIVSASPSPISAGDQDVW